MPKQSAKKILDDILPEREFLAIYLADVLQKDLFTVADELDCTDSNVKKIRRSGYEKLAASFLFPKTK